MRFDNRCCRWLTGIASYLEEDRAIEQSINGFPGIKICARVDVPDSLDPAANNLHSVPSSKKRWIPEAGTSESITQPTVTSICGQGETSAMARN
jgi:hypothetical protein